MAQWFSRKDYLMYFRYIKIISPLKRAGPFIWTNLNPIYPRMLCAKFDWNWSSGSGGEDANVKCLQQRWQRRTTDKFWSEMLTWAFGTMKKTIVLWNNQWYYTTNYGKNYCTMDDSMILHQTLWNFDLLWKKELWYYVKKLCYYSKL